LKVALTFLHDNSETALRMAAKFCTQTRELGLILIGSSLGRAYF